MPKVTKPFYVCDLCKTEAAADNPPAYPGWLRMAEHDNVWICPGCQKSINQLPGKTPSCKTIWASRDTYSTHIYLWKEEPRSRISHGDISFYGAVFSFLQSEDTLQSLGITIEPGTKIKLRISVEVES